MERCEEGGEKSGREERRRDGGGRERRDFNKALDVIRCLWFLPVTKQIAAVQYQGTLSMGSLIRLFCNKSKRRVETKSWPSINLCWKLVISWLSRVPEHLNVLYQKRQGPYEKKNISTYQRVYC